MSRYRRQAPLARRLAHLIPGYLTDSITEVDGATTHLQRGDFEALRALGHRLRGTGGTFGYPWISDQAEVLVQAAVAGDRRRAQQALRCLASVFRAEYDALQPGPRPTRTVSAMQECSRYV